MLTGNKGEWSEIYVFIKLLAEGKLHAADEFLNAIPSVYYPIIKILRQENSDYHEYLRNGSIRIFDGSENEILTLSISSFVSRSQQLFSLLKAASGRSFGFPEIESFLHSIKVHTLTALSTDKSDINLIVHDLNTGLKPRLGFSIKSMLGGNSTLFNPGKTTNFIYEVVGEGELNISEINNVEKSPIIANRILELRSKGYKLKFENIESEVLKLNLQLIDSDLPQILAELLLIKYSTPGVAKLKPTIELLTTQNPLKFNLTNGHPFYEYKIKNFLTDSALGMTPARIWMGNYDATGGIIIVKDSGELVCYHIYNRNEFQEYLLNNTCLEQASRSRYGFGNLYVEKEKVFLKLNLQFRFT